MCSLKKKQGSCLKYLKGYHMEMGEILLERLELEGRLEREEVMY